MKSGEACHKHPFHSKTLKNTKLAELDPIFLGFVRQVLLNIRDKVRFGELHHFKDDLSQVRQLCCNTKDTEKTKYRKREREREREREKETKRERERETEKRRERQREGERD